MHNNTLTHDIELHCKHYFVFPCLCCLLALTFYYVRVVSVRARDACVCVCMHRQLATGKRLIVADLNAMIMTGESGLQRHIFLVFLLLLLKRCGSFVDYNFKVYNALNQSSFTSCPEKINVKRPNRLCISALSQMPFEVSVSWSFWCNKIWRRDLRLLQPADRPRNVKHNIHHHDMCTKCMNGPRMEWANEE